MSGNKIAKAKEAAIAAVDRLRSDAIVSVVVYDQGVQVILPATKLTDKRLVKKRIQQIGAGGSTALFAGVSKGAAEVRKSVLKNKLSVSKQKRLVFRDFAKGKWTSLFFPAPKFLDANRVHRVILLSDGKANVGPDSPSELGDLGASLRKENISVSTMGLGLNYHEDLMTQLALKSNGNHLFIENADELMAVFQSEFDDVLSVVAQEIAIHIKLHAGFRPVRVLGQEAEIQGQHVTVMLNQLYAEQEKFILLELEVPATKEKESRAVADVEVSYANLQTKTTDRLTSAIAVRFSADQVFCDASRNNDVLEKSVLLIANDQNQLATRLREQGKLNEAQLLLISNGRFLETNAIKLKSDLLKLWCAENLEQAQYFDDEYWNRTRKRMVQRQNAVKVQQKGYRYYGGSYGSANTTNSK